MGIHMMMPENFTTEGSPLPVSFKGQRDYLQSADLWDAVVAILLGATPEEGWTIRMNFRSLAARTPWIYPLEGNKERPRFGDVVTLKEGESRKYLLCEGPEPVNQKVEDREVLIDPSVELMENAAVLTSDAPASPIEILVFMTKKLHLARVSNDVKWLATRLALPADLHAIVKPGVEVRLETRICHKATRSAVILNANRIGEIVFNAKP